MANHMTAEQLRAELRKISQWARDANSAPTPMGNSLVHVANSIDQLGARLSGIEQLLADREVAIAQAVEFAEYVEQAAKGKMAERAAHFLSAPYAAELRSRLSGMAAVPTAGRIYVVNRIGIATLCSDEDDARDEAQDADAQWPHNGPHVVARLSPMPTWRSIETAPKDRRVELWIPAPVNAAGISGYPTHGKWDGDQYSRRPRPFWNYDLVHRITDMRDNPPTHWRPESEPPHV